MSDRRSVRSSIKSLERIATWQLVLLLLLMIFIAATFLRLNNIGMVQRRDAVISADKQGDQTVIRNRLIELSGYVSSHMNTDLNEVYLAEQYERDKADLVKRTVNQQTQIDKEVINAKVDAICKPQYQGYSQGYVQCFAREYSKFAPGQNPISSIKMPDTERYRHVYAAPLWSPDFAGFSVLVCVLITLVIVLRLIGLWTLRILLKIRYKDI